MSVLGGKATLGAIAPQAMLEARLFDDFKGARTLLLWGDVAGMVRLRAGLTSVLEGASDKFAIEADEMVFIVAGSDGPSALRPNDNCLRWDCPRDTLEQAVELIEPLLRQQGHQYLSIEGAAEQVIISRDEYPPGLR